MSNGLFGTIRPANINISEDVEILYYYRPTRGTGSDDFEGYKSLNPTDCLVYCVTDEEHDRINGVYDLRLPLDEFNMKGFYSVYIRPKECKTKIIDVSVLASYPDVNGIVLNVTQGELAGISDLTGYRIEFEDGTSRLIKSCNRCEPVSVNIGDGYPTVTRYNLVDTSSSYVFCTVSPSSAPSFKPNATPYIGTPTEEIKVINTKFAPQLIEIEMVEHDIETLTYSVEGDQVRDRDNGILTTYNDEKEIYKQFDFYTVKSKLGKELYDVKRERVLIDNTQTYDNVVKE